MSGQTEQYTPGPNRVRHAYAERQRRVDPIATFTGACAEFDRFLAQVRRDAAREALDGLAETYEHDAYIRIYRNITYPEVTP